MLAPLIISIAMIVAFFYYETRIPPSIAAVYVCQLFSQDILLTIRVQPSTDMVPAEFCCPLWCRSPAVSLVDHLLYDLYDFMANRVPLVCHFDRVTYVSICSYVLGPAVA